MKKLLVILVCFFTLALTNSCVETACAQYDEVYVNRDITYSTVITYGTPYYIDGIISYYLYNNIYYYPYFWNNHRYLRPYYREMPRGFVYIPDRHHRPNNNLMHPEHRPYRQNERNYPIYRKPNMPNNHSMQRPNTRGNNPPVINRPNQSRSNSGGMQRGPVHGGRR